MDRSADVLSIEPSSLPRSLGRRYVPCGYQRPEPEQPRRAASRCGIWAFMSTSRPFLNTPYSAYLAREVPLPDDELVRVGPGTPCGEYLRRFWQPVAFARDLTDVPL